MPSRAELLEELRWKKFPVLDDGFVCLVDLMGDDSAVIQAARVSYGEGTRHVSDDRTLIRYLMRHRHTTPFEMAEIKLLVRVPMDCWRQWNRHRTACLAERTEVYFDLPGGIKRRGNQLHKLTIEDIWLRFQPTQNHTRPDRQRNRCFRRLRVQQMNLRQIDEQNLEIQHTRLKNVYKNGVKPVFRMTLADKKQIECTADHRFLFSDGWNSLSGATGLCVKNAKAVWETGEYYVYVNGVEVECPVHYQDRTWLNEQYNVQCRRIEDIAKDCGVSYHTIRKWIGKHGIQHEKGGRSKDPWNKGQVYQLGPRELSHAWREVNRRSRSGPASNFWKGGVSTQRESIGRWTTQIAHKIHQRNGWTCQLCHQRAGELHCHHIVPVWADESLALDEDNLTTLCGNCHRNINGRELNYVERLGGPPVKTEWKKRPRVPWNKLKRAKLVRVERFEFVGEKETYDLEVEGPNHNFIANGMVTHNSVNEYSTRYSVAVDSAQTTLGHLWRSQAKDNRQGSDDLLPVEIGERLTEAELRLHDELRKTYQDRLDVGVAREQARKDLPLSTYTEAYWKIDLHNLLHFLSLRMDAHAQKEIRDYATTIGEQIVKPLFPIVWEAFEDYRIGAMSLSRLDLGVIGRLLAGAQHGGSGTAFSEDQFLAAQDETWKGLKRCRERNECREKLQQMGILAEE